MPNTICDMSQFHGTILLTQQCNLRCSYCYVDHNNIKSINTNDIHNFINGMKYHGMQKYIDFFGGEPMLLQNLIYDIAKAYPDFSFGLTTNGTISLNTKLDWPQNITQINISTEIDKTCYMKYRGNNTLSYNIIEENMNVFKRVFPHAKIVLNISLNKYVLDHPDKLIEFYEKYADTDILLYFIKGSIDYDKYDLYDFMQNLKTHRPQIYKELLFLEDEINDFKFCCTYDDTLTLDCYGNIITCEKEGALICNVDEYDKWPNIFAYCVQNHRLYFNQCKECIVPYAFCRTSCACDLKNNSYDITKNCECERLLWLMRLKERGEI